MSANSDEIARREAAAREHIGAIYGSSGDEFGVTLFVSHHLNEIEASYWAKHLGTERPEPHQVLKLLELRASWDPDNEDEDEEGVDILDFTLPGGVTQYVISVEFDETGKIASVSMES